MNITVLSTKKLALNQKMLLLNSGIGLVEKNFISVIPLDFELGSIPKHIIFTSKNAVRMILEHPLIKELKTRSIFCVGTKTAEFLRLHDFNVVATADYGAELAEKIIKENPQEEYLFLCGRNRHRDLPDALARAKVKFSEVEVYDTRPESKNYERSFDGLLFFSPSGVQSFCQENDFLESTAFCIGQTTALEAKKHTQKVVVANKPSIENVLVQVIKHFKQTQTH
jgi:uroporphyrinogen-III synthase